MTLRCRSFSLLAVALATGCAHRPVLPVAPPIPVEALNDATSIRLRCEHPDEVIAGRAFCVLKDLPVALSSGGR